MRRALGLVAGLALATTAAACGGDEAAPTARTQAADPLSQQQAIDCLAAETRLTIAAITAGETFSPVQFMDLVAERGAEYLAEAVGSPVPTDLTEAEQLALMADVAERFAQDADMAMACRASILPAIEGLGS